MLLLLLLLSSLRPSCWLWQAVPSSSMLASASAATASWTTVWVDEFESEDIDMEKWQFQEGSSPDETAFEGGSGGRGNDSNDRNRSPRVPSSLSLHPQVYIGAHDYLVMVATTPPPPPPPQTAKADDQDAAVAAEAEPSESASSNRISTVPSANFRYGRVEVRAKASSRGVSSFWLVPSENLALSHTPCARVAIAEIRADEDSSVFSIGASINFGDYKEDRWGCTNSNAWPRKDDGCRLTAEDVVDWSDGFHVYTLEWEEEEFRWYIDGAHYCTKRDWFEKNPEDFPAPFHKTFHFEMSLEAATDGGKDDASLPVVPPEMLVDYVRISQQGPAGWWAPPANSVAEDGLGLLGDEGIISSPPTALNVLNTVLALSACVLGPYMAMTGLTRPRTNTVLMGMEIGAFKAANASYLLFGSFVIAFAAAFTFGPLVGHLALHHRVVARWNTVAGLAVPALFVLIDVGMISEIGSRYVCWAIFFVLSVTFAVLVFPPEHHALGFAVASAATGSCVLKLGLGGLLGESGEIFKILDDPLGDRCHASSVCQSLNYVMGAMFSAGILFQRKLGSCSKNRNNIVLDSEHTLEKSRSPLFTPPRARSPENALPYLRSSAQQPLVKKGTCSTSCELDLEDDQEMSIADSERQPAPGVGTEREAAEAEDQESQEGQHDGSTGSKDYDDDEAFILGLGRPKGGGGMWKRAAAGTRSILHTLFRPFSSFHRQKVPESVPPDSPTPVPMPPTGADSNAVVSNQGDTIELVIHSPHKSLLHHRRPSGWFGSFARGGDDGGGDGDGDRGDHGGRPESQLFSTTGEAEDVDEGRQERGQRRHVMNTTESPSSSGDYDDALSILSASELTNAHDLETAVMAAGAPPAETGVANNGGAPSGRLADAFSEKWGAWVRDTDSSDDGSAGGEGTGRRGYGHGRPSLADNGRAGSAARTDGGASGHSAGEFDHEALLLNPFDPHPVVGTTDPASAAAVEATDSDDGGNSRFASPLSRSSSSGSVDNERWLWRRRDGVNPPTSSGNSSGN
ncbi:unnamed protein product, partial [Pylaiella littoralis]